MNHEVDDPALIDRAQFLGLHPQECDVVRQEMSRRGEEEREYAGEHQRKPRE